MEMHYSFVFVSFVNNVNGHVVSNSFDCSLFWNREFRIGTHIMTPQRGNQGPPHKQCDLLSPKVQSFHDWLLCLLNLFMHVCFEMFCYICLYT